MDNGWVFALTTVVVTLLGAIFSHIHIRINRIEDSAKSNIDRDSNKRDKLWDAFDSHKNEFLDFKERVFSEFATKKDIEDMEGRLKIAIGGNTQHRHNDK